MKTVARILLADGKKQYVPSITQDYHCSDGVIKKADLAKKSGEVSTNKGVCFSLFEPFFIDKYEKLTRHAQIMTLKDIGAILAHAGITKNSVVLDAGSGSGAVACALAMHAKKVVTFDIDDRSLEATKTNVAFLSLKNVAVKKGNIYTVDDIKNSGAGNFDVFVLDVPQPWDALLTAQAMLKPGGFLVSYSPQTTQVHAMVVAAKKMGFIHVQTIEIIQRSWQVDEQRCRPDFQSLGHTGFLSFLRR
ncbi:MAG: methyltransferase domain-containing protein [Candidatus Woesearchaeota archaeon]|nr:methyltransferase domain-containing protein [Candidatus Woesearchaeota archaeon]